MNQVEKLALVCGFSLPGEPAAAELRLLADIRTTLVMRDVIGPDDEAERRIIQRLIRVMEKLIALESRQK